jgi:hypothetical protein
MTTAERRSPGRWLPDLKAEALAWWVRSSSERRLQSVMRSRLRSVLLWQIFRTMRQRARPDPRLDAVVEFRISGRRDGGVDCYQLILTDGRCRTSRGGKRRPASTLELEPVAFLRLVSGAASAQRLWLAGKLRLRGDLMVTLDLPATLRPPAPRPGRRSASAGSSGR